MADTILLLLTHFTSFCSPDKLPQKHGRSTAPRRPHTNLFWGGCGSWVCIVILQIYIFLSILFLRVLCFVSLVNLIWFIVGQSQTFHGFNRFSDIISVVGGCWIYMNIWVCRLLVMTIRAQLGLEDLGSFIVVSHVFGFVLSLERNLGLPNIK